ncbi:MAG TPA: tetratricopeptide repeat protein [Candidatus Dormibacteraeota bacterium]|nr:tetratricopeptide repeat protein [Candidatus Dormibacteraeota bacterium]
MEPPAQAARMCFGPFQVDLRSRELSKHGIRLKLQDQPFQVLALLLEHAGDIVTREELRQRLWPADTFVDFDTGLNSAVKKLRDVLADSADEPRYIETIPRRGYRFIAPLIDPNPATVPSSAPEPELHPAHETTCSRPAGSVGTAAESFSFTRLRLLFGAAALLLLFVAGFLVYRSTGARRPTQPAIKSLAVLPLKNLSGDASQDYLADGITEALIGRLSVIHNLRVISRTSVTRFKDTHLSAPEIARTLQVDSIFEGSVICDGGRVRVHAQLIRAATDDHLWSEAYDRELRDVLSLESDVAQSIARKVEVTVTGEEHARLSSARAVEQEAYEAYLKGRYHWNKRTADGMAKAALYFQQATDRDPGYAAAYSGLADCNSGLAWHGFMSPEAVLPKAFAAAQKAVEIDPQSAEAHASLALVLDHKWDWTPAEVEFKHALNLNPQYANAHHWYGDYLSIQGRHDEALVEAKRALELDPLNLMIGTWVGLRYYLARKYDGAIDQSQKTVDLDPNFAAAHLILGESYAQQGKHKRGLNELQNAAGLSEDSPIYVAQVGVSLALAGEKKEALRVIRELQDTSGKRYVSPYGVAQIYAALNDKEQTYKWLETAYRDRAVWISYLAVDPVFDSIRSEEPFLDLLRRVGLPR